MWQVQNRGWRTRSKFGKSFHRFARNAPGLPLASRLLRRAPLDDDDLDHQAGGEGDDHDENDTDDDGTFLQASWQFKMWER